MLKEPNQLTGILIEFINNKFDEIRYGYQWYPIFLRGFKSTSYIETGYVYAPYIPMTIIEPLENNFEVKGKLKSRYSKKKINRNFYGTIRI